MKICTKCQEEKELTEFYKTKTTKSGLQGQCKVCCKANSNKARHQIVDDVYTDIECLKLIHTFREQNLREFNNTK